MKRNKILTKLLLVVLILPLSMCNTRPPSDSDNICKIFREKSGWHKDAKKASEKWGIPIHVMMATIYQESHFVGNAKPPRKKILGFLPGPRPSTAYGYAQVLDETWDYYQKQTGQWGKDRDKFGDSMEFIGWYYKQSTIRNKVSAWDTYSLYLTYHEGHGGFSRGSYKSKPWLINVAKKVKANGERYAAQYASCKDSLNRPWWLPD